MKRKINVQTSKSEKKLEETLKEKILKNNNEKKSSPDNTGDAIASTNSESDSITVDIEDLKTYNLIKKFKSILLDDSTDNDSIKEMRKSGIIPTEDIQLFVDIINNEAYDKAINIPQTITCLILKLYDNDIFDNLPLTIIKQLAGYYNFLIEKINIPVDNINKDSYYFKLAENYINTWIEAGKNKYQDVTPIIDNLKSINYKSNNLVNENNDKTNKLGEFLLSIPEENKNIDDYCKLMNYEEINHPNHYNVYDMEVVEMMERIFGIQETMSWCKLNAFKYRMRAGEKPTSTVEKDLKKEKWCLNKYHELKSKL